MSCSVPLPPSLVPSSSFSPSVDGRFSSFSHSPSLSASPFPPSPASTAAYSGPCDGQSPLSLSSPAPPASVDPFLPPPPPPPSVPVSVAERVRSLIHGYSTALIASAVREKAWSDLQRLEEIFASPAEQAHLTKQQKWKLALRRQRLQLYLQHEHGVEGDIRALQQSHEEEEEEQKEGVAGGGVEEAKAAEEQPTTSSGPLSAPPSSSSRAPPSSSLTIFTTPPLPPAHPTSSLARELSSFSLYTPEGLASSTGAFSFSLPPRSPSAPAEAAYTIPTYDSSLSIPHLSDSPSTPSSSSSASSSHSPVRPRSQTLPSTVSGERGGTAAEGEEVEEEEPSTVSRSGRRIKRKFDLSSLAGRRVKKVSVGSEGEALRPSSRAKAAAEEKTGRGWEKEAEDSEGDDDEEEEEEDEREETTAELQGGAVPKGYGVAYRH